MEIKENEINAYIINRKSGEMVGKAITNIKNECNFQIQFMQNCILKECFLIIDKGKEKSIFTMGNNREQYDIVCSGTEGKIGNIISITFN